MCAQWRLRSVLTFAQSDQSLRCPHEKILGPHVATHWAHSEDSDQTESSPAARIILLVLSWGGSYMLFPKFQKKLNEKSRESHNHKSQKPLDASMAKRKTKKKRIQDKQNKWTKTLASFCSWADRSVSYLLAKSPKQVFSWPGSYDLWRLHVRKRTNLKISC